MPTEWPEHSKKIVQGVNTLQAFHDLTLSAQGKQIKAHRVILASVSTYFRELLLDSQNEEKFPIVFLKDVKYEDLQSIIDWIYTGKAQISTSVLELAETLGISGLEYMKKSPKKRKSLESVKENASPFKFSASEPVSMPSWINSPSEIKRRKIHSLDNEVLSPPTAFKSSSKATSTSTVIIKKSPANSPVKKMQNLSCPVQDEIGKSEKTVSNFSFDSTYSSMNPEELVFRGANILQTLATWMLQEQKNHEKIQNMSPPPAPPNSLKSNPSSTSKRRVKGESNSGDRPDSGFDSKDEDEIKISSVHQTQFSEAISEEAGVRTASSEDTSPEINVEISRQAAIRQPVFRKRRLNN